MRTFVLAVAAALAVSACRMDAPEREAAKERETETGYRGRVHEDPSPRPDFVLRDARGGSFDFRRETDGYLTLLFFGYTHCPDVCPIHMSSIAAVKRDLGAEFGRQTKVVFVTVDPKRDTPERLITWLGGFDPDFIGLYGDPATIDSIQVRLGLPPAVVPDTSADDYVVGHGSPVIGWPANDGVRVDFPFGTRQEDWRHDLQKLAALGGSD